MFIPQFSLPATSLFLDRTCEAYQQADVEQFGRQPLYLLGAVDACLKLSENVEEGCLYDAVDLPTCQHQV